MNIVWTNEEKQLIENNANHMKDKELALQIAGLRGKPISVQAVRKMRQKIYLKLIPSYLKPMRNSEFRYMSGNV